MKGESEKDKETEKGQVWATHFGKNLIKSVSFVCGGVTIELFPCKTCCQSRQEYEICFYF